MTTFKKDQKYTYVGGIENDGSLPSDNAVIQIISARGKFVKYLILEGQSPEKSKEQFSKNSQMAEKLVLLQ